MRFRLVLCLALLSATVPAQAQQAKAQVTPTVFDDPATVGRFQQTITAEELAGHLYFLASDFMEGRETGRRGQKMAAEYLASVYRNMGLEPRGTVSGADPLSAEAFYQRFNLYGYHLESARLLVQRENGNSLDYHHLLGSSGFSLFQGTTPVVEGGLVFAGYGIADSALGYDDYAALRKEGIDVNGRFVLILANEPLKDSSQSLLPTPEGMPSRRWSNDTAKISTAFANGARGIIIVTDSGDRFPGDWIEKGLPPQIMDAVAERLTTRKENAGLIEMKPVYLMTAEDAGRLIGRSVVAIRQEIDASLKPVVFDVPGVMLRSEINFPFREVSTENIVAYIEGSDPVLKDEVVILSAHYDHIGMLPSGEDRVFNGADDDGSGTVALLEMAEAFSEAARTGFGPRRSILFLSVTGEEKGLLGSTYYTDTQPVFPLSKTVANLNIDMIGRHDPSNPRRDSSYVYIIGSNLISKELHDINLRVNKTTGTGLRLDERFNSRNDPNQFYRRSDHWNFGKHGIPFIFFFTGTHEDYHGLGDEPQKIDYERMARISRLIFGTAWQLANQDSRPAVSGKGFN